VGLQLTYYAEEERLDLTVSETLDHGVADQIMEACNYINDRLLTCVIDCSRVERVHESGRVLLRHLIRILESYRIRLIMLGVAVLQNETNEPPMRLLA
jgi:ABC-type transporter Mla MlaB component